MFYDMRQCAFCKKTTWVSRLVKYSTRRYAHSVCLYKRKGLNGLRALSDTNFFGGLEIVKLTLIGVDVEALWDERRLK